MSPLIESCLRRIRAGDIDAEKLAQFFEVLAEQAKNLDESRMDYLMFFIDEDDDFEEGKYVPELHFVVRRVEPNTEGEDDEQF